MAQTQGVRPYEMNDITHGDDKEENRLNTEAEMGVTHAPAREL